MSAFFERGDVMWVIGLTLFLLGIMLIIVYAVTKSKQKRCSAKVQGTLIDYTEADPDDVDSRSNYFYSYIVNGVEYRLRTVERSPEVNGVGDSCTIYYNPGKPGDALVYKIQSNKLLTLLLVLGIALIPIGFIVFVIGTAGVV